MGQGVAASPRATKISLAVMTAAGLGVLALFALLGTVASYTRGIWLDEAWSILEGQRDLSFKDAFMQRWRFELSPPYFYITSWLFQPLVGDGIFGRRLLNLIPLAAAAITFWALGRRDPRHVPLLVLVALLLLSNNFTATFFPEHRAYFTIVAGSAVIAVALALMFATGNDYRRQDRLIAGVAFGGMLVVFSLHYIVAFEVGLIVGATIAIQWLRGMRRWAIALAVAATLASIPIVAAFVVQSATLQYFAQHGWIQTSGIVALLLLMLVLASLFLPVAVALIASLPFLRVEADNFSARRTYILASAAAFLLSFAGLMAANQVQPLVVHRYLLAYIPFVIVPSASLAAPLFATNRLFFAVVIAATVGLTVTSFATVAREGRWNDTARLILAVRAACPDAQVIAVPYWRFHPGYVVGPNEPEAWRLGLDQVARRFDFSFHHSASEPTAPQCPTILWVEHFLRPPPPGQVIAAAELNVSASRARRAITRRGGSGFVTIIPAR